MKNQQIHLSIVSPIYKGANIVAELVKQVTTYAQQITDNYEFILIDDGSPDHAWAEIERACTQNPKVKGVKLSRNFGQHYALTAGLAQSKGEWVVVLDGDLQDKPKYIPVLHQKAQEGYAIVFTEKQKRQHAWFRNVAAQAYNQIFRWLNEDINLYNSRQGNYTILHRKVVHAFLDIKDAERHYLMVLRWLGFKQTVITIEQDQRFEGKSSYSLIRLIKFGIGGIVSQSMNLLYVALILGGMLVAGSLLGGLIFLLNLLLTTSGGSNWQWMLLLALFFCTGLILTAIGILGIYIGKTFEQAKQRPLYIIEKQLNC